MLPCAGYTDHGFYSFSPTYFLDIYKENRGWNVCDLCFFVKEKNDIVSAASKSQDCRLFKSAWEEEKYVRKALSDGCGSIQIQCIARKEKQLNIDIPPMQGIYEKHTGNFDLVLKLKTEPSIVMYGCGDDGNEVMNVLYKNNMEYLVDYVFDSDISKAGMVFRGKEIRYPNKKNLETCIKKILIASSKYEAQIYKFLLNQGVEKERILRFSDLDKLD